MSYMVGASYRERRQWAGVPVQALGRELVLPAAFILAILASNYALASQPNVKLFDLLVFTAGFTLGFRRGASGGRWARGWSTGRSTPGARQRPAVAGQP